MTDKETIAFWKKVNKSTPEACWEWTGAIGSGGYGNFWAGGKSMNSHRVSFQMHHRVLMEGEEACHSCDNRRCVNPDHLWAGSRAENANDMAAKGRSTAGDRNPSRKYPERRARGVKHGSKTRPESVCKGERVGTSKLLEDQVKAIRTAVKEGTVQRQIAKQYGISPSLVNLIVKGRVGKSSLP